MSKVLVLGASGLVGSHVSRVLARDGHEVHGTYRTHSPGPVGQSHPFDVERDGAENFHQILKIAHPNIVVNCIAWPYVDGCQREPMRSHVMNQSIPTRIAQMCADARIRYVFFSSGYVFGAGRRTYDELDMPFGNVEGPANVYGDDKLQAEVGIRAVCPHALIVRTVGVFGRDQAWKCFAARLVKCLKHGKKLAFDPRGTSNWTWAHDLAEDVAAMLDDGLTGTYHSAGRLVCERGEFARLVCELLNLDQSLIVHTDAPEGSAPRLKNCVLSSIRAGYAYDNSESLPVAMLHEMLEEA